MKQQFMPIMELTRMIKVLWRRRRQVKPSQSMFQTILMDWIMTNIREVQVFLADMMVQHALTMKLPITHHTIQLYLLPVTTDNTDTIQQDNMEKIYCRKEEFLKTQ